MAIQIKYDLSQVKVNESVFSQLPDYTYTLCVKKANDLWGIFQVKDKVIKCEFEVNDPSLFINPVNQIFDEETTNSVVEEWKENYVHYINYESFIYRLVNKMYPY